MTPKRYIPVIHAVAVSMAELSEPGRRDQSE